MTVLLDKLAVAAPPPEATDQLESSPFARASTGGQTQRADATLCNCRTGRHRVTMPPKRIISLSSETVLSPLYPLSSLLAEWDAFELLHLIFSKQFEYAD